MADNPISDVGVGISLSGKAPRGFESIIGRRLALDGAEQRAKAAAANKPEKLINLDDFGNNPDLYPAIATQVKKIKTDAANRFNEIKAQVGDENKARNLWEVEMLNKKEDIAQLVHTNNVLKDYELKKSQKTFLTPERDDIMATANNPNATADDWVKLNNAENGITATPTFGFSANLTQRRDLPAEIKKMGIANTISGVRSLPILDDKGNHLRDQYIEEISHEPTTEEAAKVAGAILSDPDAVKNYESRYRENSTFKSPDFNSQDETARKIGRLAEMTQFVKQYATDKTQMVKAMPYHEPQPKEGETQQGASWSKQPLKEIPRNIEGANGATLAPLQSSDHYSIKFAPSTEGKATFSVKNAVDLSDNKPIRGEVSTVRDMSVGKTVINGKEGVYAFLTVPKEKVASVTADGKTTPQYSDTKIIAVPYDEVRGQIKSYTANKHGANFFDYYKLEPQYKQGVGEAAKPSGEKKDWSKYAIKVK